MRDSELVDVAVEGSAISGYSPRNARLTDGRQGIGVS
jgi:hypothetical protein